MAIYFKLSPNSKHLLPVARKRLQESHSKLKVSGLSYIRDKYVLADGSTILIEIKKLPFNEVFHEIVTIVSGKRYKLSLKDLAILVPGTTDRIYYKSENLFRNRDSLEFQPYNTTEPGVYYEPLLSISFNTGRYIKSSNSVYNYKYFNFNSHSEFIKNSYKKKLFTNSDFFISGNKIIYSAATFYGKLIYRVADAITNTVIYTTPDQSASYGVYGPRMQTFYSESGNSLYYIYQNNVLQTIGIKKITFDSSFSSSNTTTLHTFNVPPGAIGVEEIVDMVYDYTPNTAIYTTAIPSSFVYGVSQETLFKVYILDNISNTLVDTDLDTFYFRLSSGSPVPDLYLPRYVSSDLSLYVTLESSVDSANIKVVVHNKFDTVRTTIYDSSTYSEDASSAVEGLSDLYSSPSKAHYRVMPVFVNSNSYISVISFKVPITLTASPYFKERRIVVVYNKETDAYTYDTNTLTPGTTNYLKEVGIPYLI